MISPHGTFLTGYFAYPQQTSTPQHVYMDNTSNNLAHPVYMNFAIDSLFCQDLNLLLIQLITYARYTTWKQKTCDVTT